MAVTLISVGLVQAGGYLAALAWHLLIARWDVVQYGMLSLASAIVLILTHVGNLGQRAALIRFAPRLIAQRQHRDVVRLLRIAFAAPPLVLAMTWVLYEGARALGLGSLPPPFPAWAPAALAACGIAAALLASLAGYFQAAGRTVLGAFVSTSLLPIFILAAMVATVRLFPRIADIFRAYTGAHLAGLLVCAVAIPIVILGARNLTTSATASSATESGTDVLAFGIKASALGLVYLGLTQLDKLMLGAMSGLESVGIYNLPAKLVSAMTFIIYLFPPIVGPIYSRYLATDRSELALDAYQASSFLAAAATVPIALIFIVLGSDLLGTLGGAQYSDGVPVLVVVALGTLAVTTTGNNGLLLQMGGKENIELLLSAGTLLTNVVLNLVLIPSMGVLGAAVATACSLVVSTVCKVAICHRRWRVWPIGRAAIRLGAATVVGGAVMAAARLGADLPWPVLAVAGSLAYLLVVGLGSITDAVAALGRSRRLAFDGASAATDRDSGGSAP